MGMTGRFINIRLMLRELVIGRELIWRFFVRDFSARYRQAALGVLWAVILPVVTVGIFVGMNSAGILKVEGIDVPYTIYALVGLTVFNLFNGGILACTQCVVSAENMLKKINFPRTSIVFAASLGAIMDFFIRSILVIIVFVCYRETPHPIGVFTGLLAIVPLFLLTLGLGFFLGLISGIMRDISNLLSFASMGFMLLTPVLYPIEGENLLAKVSYLNPLNYLINVPRDLILRGTTDLMTGYMWSVALSVVVFYLGWHLFFIAQTKISERI
jgi:lipopolysaccharide transport system permease protein